MTTVSVDPPFPIISDVDGQPLEDGYVWIGFPNLSPIVNPVAVYWDIALTIPAAQPIRTQGGFMVNSGTPARVYINGDYSIQVQNKNGTVLYTAPSFTGPLRNMGLFDGLIWNTANWIEMNTTEPHIGSSQGAFAVTHTTTGSGANGPTNSDVAIYIKTLKDISLDSTDQGEIDGTYTFVDQRGQGDAAGHLVHAENVYRDIAPVSQGMLAIETTARRRNNLGQYIQYGHAWLAHAEALQPNYGQLLGIDMRLGTTKDGILVDTFPDRTNAAPSALDPSYEWIFRYRQARLDSSQLFGITGTGRMQFGPNTNKFSVFWTGTLFNMTNNSDVGVWSINATGDMFCTGSSNDGIGNLRQVPFQLDNPTGSYTVVASDIGKLLFRTAGSVTINNGVFTSLGQMLQIRNESDVTMTVTRGTGTPTFRVNGSNVSGDRTIAARSTIRIMYSGTNDFVFEGPVT